MPITKSWLHLVPWAARLGWIAVAVAGTPALQSALEGRSDTVRWVATGLSGVIWLVGVAAVAIGATATLTLARVTIPTVIPATVLGLVAGADLRATLGTVSCALSTVAVVNSPEYGQIAVQSSAYGNEVRFLLRPPVGYLIAAIATWVLWVAALFGGAALAATGREILGVGLILLAGVLTVLAVPRWHRLSTRWLVFVPAGIVIHDPVTLSDTVMLKRSEIRHITLAASDTEAFDLSGPASGHALEIATTDTITVVCAAVGRAAPRAIHLTAMLVAPSRPGRALRAAADRALLQR